MLSTLKQYYGKAGCRLTDDSWKIDVDKTREKVQKAKSLIVLLEKGVFWRPEIMKKMLWAMDSVEANNLFLLDISEAFGNFEAFDFDEYNDELALKEGEDKFKDLVKSLVYKVEKTGSLSQLTSAIKNLSANKNQGIPTISTSTSKSSRS